MMRGKSHVASKVASTTLAYPGNPFKYSPKFHADEPERKLNMDDVITTTLQSKVANTTSSVCSNRRRSGSLVPSSNGKTQEELSKDDSDSGSFQRQSRLPSQKCDEIYSLSEEESVGSGGQNQEQPQTEKITVEVLQQDERNFQEIEHSCNEKITEVKNGPKKYKNWPVYTLEQHFWINLVNYSSLMQVSWIVYLV